MGRTPETRAMMPTNWFLWDGECDFCRCAAAWIAHRLPDDSFTIIPYQDAPAPPMTPLLRIQSARQVQLIDGRGVRHAGAEAILFALQIAGWHAGVARALRRRPLRWFARTGYWLVARNRGRLTVLCRRSMDAGGSIAH